VEATPHTKPPEVKAWLAMHPRFRFILTSSLRLNLSACWYRELNEKRIRRGSFYSVEELVAAIEEYMQQNNH
jgi:hypothetical protein